MGRGAVWSLNEAKIAVWRGNQLSGRHMGDGPSRGMPLPLYYTICAAACQ